ncbi:MAG: DNA-binding response regulator [Saprospirales bacterium]|nr:MAG: DNA-binding response regulator [Saprospirales bacterium]
MIKVLICDDHKIVASGIKSLMRFRKDISIVGEAIDREELFELLREVEVDIILMDLVLREESGIEITKIVRKLFPKIKIIALTMQNDYTSIREMSEAGAMGYLLKNSSIEKLCEAITSVFNGTPYHSREVTQILLNQMHVKTNKANEIDLTDREKVILKMLSDGLTTREIAQTIFLSEATVKWYRKKLLTRFDQPNVAALVKFAYVNQLIS